MSEWKNTAIYYKSLAFTTNFSQSAIVIPSQSTYDVQWTNPKVFSSTSAFHFANEGLYFNEVIKNTNDKFTINKYTTNVERSQVLYVNHYYYLKATNGGGEKTANIPINITDPSVIMLTFYIYYRGHAYHVNAPGYYKNKKPIQLGLKLYDSTNAGTPYFNIGNINQLNFADFSVIGGIHTAMNEHIESVWGAVVKEVKHPNLASFGGKSLILECYLPPTLPNDYPLMDSFLSSYEVYIAIHRKASNLELDNTNIFIFEDKNN